MVLEKDELSLTVTPYKKTSRKCTRNRRQKLKANQKAEAKSSNRGYQIVLSKETFISINRDLMKEEKEKYDIEL